MSVTPKVRAFHEMVSEHMESIAAALSPETHITLVIRHPGMPEREMVFSDDPETAEIIKTIERRRALPPDIGSLPN